MAIILFIVLLFVALMVLISVRLKKRNSRILLWVGLLIVIPLSFVAMYQYGKKQEEAELRQVTAECRHRKQLEKLRLYFDGFAATDFKDSAFTIRKNAAGLILDSNKQQIDTIIHRGETVTVIYDYHYPFALNDVFEVQIGKRKYILRDFVLRPDVNYSGMGQPVISGDCIIDSASINGKRTAFSYSMFIRKQDVF